MIRGPGPEDRTEGRLLERTCSDSDGELENAVLQWPGRPKGERMKLTILYNGYLDTDKNNVVACSTIGTLSNPKVENKMIRLPVMAFLIETDDGQYILYDTGCHPDAMKGWWPKGIQEAYALVQKPEERLENQLAKAGVKPEDISTVVLSHMHMDHAGNIAMFAHADVYVPREDFAEGQMMSHISTDVTKHGAYIKAEMEAPVKQYHLVSEDCELAPGVELICLPGHTPNLLGVVVHLAGGTFILPQDACYTGEIYGPPAKASGLLYDSINFFKSIEKVRKLEKKYNATVVDAHDWDFFQTLKTAPEYYE